MEFSRIKIVFTHLDRENIERFSSTSNAHIHQSFRSNRPSSNRFDQQTTILRSFERVKTRTIFLLFSNRFFSSRMGTDLSRSEIDLVWSSSGLPVDKSIPFSNLIRQIILFNREENQWMISQRKSTD